MTPQSRQPRSATEQTPFHWQAIVRAKALEPGWHEHLTSQVFAVATVPVVGNGPILPAILEVHVLGHMERLYKARVREDAVDVRVAYEALAHMRLREAPPCELRIKTTDGVHGVTIDPPTPPSQEEWQEVVEQLWSQLRGDEELRLDWGIAPYQPGQSGVFLPQRLLLSRFRLFPHMQWEEMPPTLRERHRPTTWQQELRLERDQFHPWVLHARVGWREREDTAEVWAPPAPPPAGDDTEAGSEADDLLGESDEWFPGGEDAPEIQRIPTKPRTAKPLAPAPIDWQSLLKRRGGLMLVGAVLLAFIMIAGSVLTLGFLGGKPQGDSSSVVSIPASPTSATGAQPSPTPQSSAAATSPTSTSPTPSPTRQATSTPTATATPGPVVNWSVATAGSTSQRCSPPHPNVSALTLTIDNTRSTAALTWQVTITDTDPAGKVWATASTTSGTVAAGQQAKTTLTPISSLCQDMAGSKNPFPYHAVISGSAAGQTKQVTITVTVKP